ncbi:ABC transporter substrate-binding protein [Cohnella pontilimi]|uniref:ABC transporter substrate-binding protein n=2 Tax=Cohnella pontilimi TaxID=2564100 RepID=A0A4U0FCL4_9BACL|nr:ABC transporter substrate-binding protein [Cohnella pontilimi]
MWSHKDPGIDEADSQLVADFQAAHPDIKIKFESYPYDEYVQKLKASFKTSGGPDIAEFFGTWVAQYAKNDLLEAVPNGKDLIDKYFEAPIGGYVYNGNVYGLPLEYNIENNGMLAHPQMFKDKGLSYPPKTWDELVSAAQKLTVMDGNNLKVRGFDFTSYDNVTYLFLALILQQGGNYWGGDGHFNFQSPEAEKAMNELVKLTKEYKVADYNQMGAELDGSDYFYKGESAMTYRGPWTIPTGKNVYNVDDFEYVAVPSFTSNPPSFAAESGWGIVVNKQTKHKEAAMEFLKFASQPDNVMKWNITTFTVPSLKAVAENPKYLKQLPMMKAPLSQLQYGKWIGPIGDRDFMWDTINNEFPKMASGEVSVKDGLKNLEETLNKMLDEQK